MSVIGLFTSESREKLDKSQIDEGHAKMLA